MSLIDKTYFTGDINLPSQVLDGDYATITGYITKYEKEVLIMLLGYDLYKELKAEIDEGVYSTKWDNFVNGAEYIVEYGSETYTVKWNGLVNTEKVSLIAYYIYYQFIRDNVTDTTIIGEVLSQSENSTRVTPADKMVSAYNSFVSLYGTLNDGEFHPSSYRYLYENESDYDKWLFTEVKPINTFGV